MLYPKPILTEAFLHQPSLKKDVWLALKNISDEMLISGGRVYGGGLHKLEPKELGNVLVNLFSIGDNLLHLFFQQSTYFQDENNLSSNSRGC